MTTSDITPRVYVACLASYNSGVLHGEWIDLEGKDADDIHAEIAKMLRASKFPNVEVDCVNCNGIGKIYADHDCSECAGTGKVRSAEEWAIHDYELGGVKIDENPDIEKLVELAEGLSEHGKAYVAYVDHVGAHYATKDGFEDAYAGEYPSSEDFAIDRFQDQHPPEESLMDTPKPHRNAKTGPRPVERAHLFYPRLPDNTRKRMLLDDADHAAATRRTLGFRAEVHDWMTGCKFRIYGAACGIKGCHCDALARIVVPI